MVVGQALLKMVFNREVTGCALTARVLNQPKPTLFTQTLGYSLLGRCLGKGLGSFALGKNLLPPKRKDLPEERRAGWTKPGTNVLHAVGPLKAFQHAVW